ncbi:hypothetical protein [Nocardioides massiliensis]|uniref:Sulfotransferase family protein n=1 Tax=Nocardioides massiliensis TaxID=1325935 RepID=A0ABT9NUN6_9ACTN|nr:hypothetical protein [Nocardioides massiliensis]MDP9824143.1 hypothetical protein [Nocardioides massiliensis]
MAERVVVHVGQPKTGTTYLQTIAWHHRDRLAELDGVRLPGDQRVDHLWTSLAVREDPKLAARRPSAATAIDRVLEGIASWPGTAVVSHEFLGAATSEQARRFLGRMRADRVEVLVTAREPVSLMAAAWQESLKLRRTTPLREFADGPTDDTGAVWSLRSLDLAGVLDRWAPHVAPGDTHVIVLPRKRGAPDELWHRFAEVVGLTADAYDTGVAASNRSMALPETEFLRRLQPHLAGIEGNLQRNWWVRRYLAEGHLAGREGPRIGLYADQVEACRVRGEEAVAAVERHGVRVHGAVDDLRAPADLPAQVTPDDLPVDAVLDAGVRTILDVATDLVRTRRVADA